MKSNSVPDTVTCVGDWLKQARRKLAAQADPQVSGSTLELQVLLASVLGKSRAWVIAHPDAPLSPLQAQQLDHLAEQLASGVPLPYLTGEQEFFGMEFHVSPAVLIPRPETELLVERALEWLQRNPGRRKATDIGTGSGCIAISLARHTPDLHMTAIDRSWQALQIARQNCARHGVDRQISLLQSNLLSAAAGPLDLVCANLPYIPSQDLPNLAVTRHEPLMALDGGPDGMQLIDHLLADAPRWLAPGGLMLLEMQFDQGEEISNRAQVSLPGAQISVLPDLAGLPRLVYIQNS